MLVVRGKSLAAILVGFCLVPGLASAKLGGKLDSIGESRLAYGTKSRQVVNHTGYTVHESASAGLTVREFADASGTIFAVAWQGVTQPDLTAILGDFNGEYLTAFHQTPRAAGRRNFSHVESGNIIVEKSGHMRAMGGRAYITALIPSGVDMSQIR